MLLLSSEGLLAVAADIGRVRMSGITPLKPILVKLLYIRILEMLIVYCNVSVLDLGAYNEHNIGVSVVDGVVMA